MYVNRRKAAFTWLLEIAFRTCIFKDCFRGAKGNVPRSSQTAAMRRLRTSLTRGVRPTAFYGLLVVLLVAPYPAVAQQDGVPIFGAADVHDNDAINLQTLVPTINIPVVSKSEAIPLGITLTAQQYCYTWSSDGSYIRKCNGEFGAYASGLLNGTLTYSKAGPVSGNCPNGGTATSYSGWYLLTSDGLDAHPIDGSKALILNDAAHIGLPQGNCTATYSVNGITMDGSGYTVSFSVPTGTLSPWSGPVTAFSVTAKNGARISGLYSPTATLTDTFGNTSSSTVTSGPTYAYTDSLGVANTATTTITGDRTTVNGSVQYLDTNGNTQTVTLQRSATLYETYIAGTCKGAGQGFSIYPLQSINFPDSTSMSFTYEVGGLPNTLTGRVSSFTARQGGQISYQYSAACGNSSPNTLTRTTSDGATTYSTSLGVTTVTDPGGNKTVYSIRGGTFLTEKDVYRNTGTVSSPVYALLSKDVYCYNNNQTNCTSATITYPVTQRDVYHYVDTNSLAISHTTTIYDAYGNVTSSSVYDYITGQTEATNTTYSGCGQGSTINDRACDIKIVSGSNTLSETKFTYNSNGALLTKSVWTGSTWLTTNYTPNSNGTTASVQDPNGLVLNLGYAARGSGGCNGLLPTSLSTTINGVQINSSQTWDCNAGVVLTTTDANNHGTHATYDSMLRPSSYTDESLFQTTFGYTSNSVSSSASFGSSVLNDVIYLDGLDRSINSQTQQGPNSTNYDTTSSTYGFSGTNRQIQTSSAPCTQPIDRSCSANDTTLLDPLGRPISSLDGLGGTVAYSYSQNDVSMSVGPKPAGENYKTLQTEVDGLGRTKSVCALEASGGAACGQAMGGSGILTTYAYSFANGSTTATTARGSQSRSQTYDAMGRLVSETTPEAGTTHYFYDLSAPDCSNGQVGDLLEKKDNAGIVTCYWHDSLHRVIAIAGNYSQNPHPCQIFAYDTSAAPNASTPPSGATFANTAGRLVEAWTNSDCNGQTNLVTAEWFSYDANGRMTDFWEQTPHSNGYYHTSVTFNPNGTVSAINGIPGYTGYIFGVDGEGRTSTAAQGTTTIINGVTRDAAGSPTQVLVGTNSADSDTFAYNSLEQMKNYTFTVNGKSMSGALGWNQNGSLGSLGVTDTFNTGGTQNCTFSYDDVSRLLTDNCGSSLWNQTYSYDQYDNLTKTGNPGTSWIPGYNPANNQFLGGTFDSDGNVTFDGTNSYAWDGYGKLLGTRSGNGAVSCGSSGSTCVTYDAFGNIAEVYTAAKATEILYSPIGRLALMNGATTVSESVIPLPGGLLLKATGMGGASARIIMHSDWLGTDRFAHALGTRTWTFDTAYTPYGEAYDSFGTLKPDFTGDLQDISSGLFDTPNRELAINASRWLSPDPAGASWNAYSYPTDPNTQTDPTGLCNEQGGGSEDGGGGECSGFGGGDFNFSQDLTDWATPNSSAPSPAARCGFLCRLIGLFGGGGGNNGPVQARDPIEAGWDDPWISFAFGAVRASREANNALQNSKKGVDWYNEWLGFKSTNCSSGGDCIGALGMAATSAFVAIDSFGESEEPNAAKALKQLKEAPAVVNFLRNELLAQAKDPALRDAIDNLFRAGARLGDGSSMGALREEIQTGAERRHWQKLLDRRTQLLRIYRSGSLGSSDRVITRYLLISIQDALSTRPPI